MNFSNVKDSKLVDFWLILHQLIKEVYRVSSWLCVELPGTAFILAKRITPEEAIKEPTPWIAKV